MKKKIIIALPVLLIVLGGVYKFALAKPAPVPKPKIEGEVYVLPKDFLVNTSDGRFAKVNVALVIEEGSAAPAAGGEEAAAEPPEGFGTMPQEAAVRDIITNTLSDVSGKKIIKRKGRESLKKRILKQILTKTDVKAHDVLFTDVAVQ
jgi:flagellar basal body-associated protein FliL